MTAFLQELVHVGLYKRSQGRVTRQITFATIAIIGAYGLWRLSDVLVNFGLWLQNNFSGAESLWKSLLGWGFWQYALPSALLLVFLWMTYRLVNVPAFADFLIAVEAEMNKVSWPSRQELFRGSAVVLITIIALAIVLFGFDTFWIILFTWIDIL